MSKVDNDYLNELVQRFSNYKSPTDAQKLIIELGQKVDRTEEDNKKLNILLQAEKKVEQLNQARAKTRKLLQEEKAKERKKRTRKLVIWGNALTNASEEIPEMRAVMHKLFNGGFIADKDLEIVREDLTELARKYDAQH